MHTCTRKSSGGAVTGRRFVVDILGKISAILKNKSTYKTYLDIKHSTTGGSAGHTGACHTVVAVRWSSARVAVAGPGNSAYTQTRSKIPPPGDRKLPPNKPATWLPCPSSSMSLPHAWAGDEPGGLPAQRPHLAQSAEVMNQYMATLLVNNLAKSRQ
jgi:hypothetical protein